MPEQTAERVEQPAAMPREHRVACGITMLVWFAVIAAGAWHGWMNDRTGQRALAAFDTAGFVAVAVPLLLTVGGLVAMILFMPFLLIFW